MNSEKKNTNNERIYSRESFKVELTSPMLYDRLHILSVEYSVSVEELVNTAVRRLIDDVEFVRGLRIGKIDSE